MTRDLKGLNKVLFAIGQGSEKISWYSARIFMAFKMWSHKVSDPVRFLFGIDNAL